MKTIYDPATHMPSATSRYAEDHRVYAVRTGSQLYGTVVSANADTDEMAIFVEGKDSVFSVNPSWHRPHTVQCRTAGKREDGTDAPSGPDDVDTTYYSLSHFIRECAKGNPNALQMLFVPQDMILFQEPTRIAASLRLHADRFHTRRAGKTFLGYLRNQRRMYLENAEGKTHRPDLVAEFGYDTKGAYHALRIGMQGLEYLTQGIQTLPLDSENRHLLLAVRRGEYSKAQVLIMLDGIERSLEHATSVSTLPDEPDYDLLTRWSTRLHEYHWLHLQEREKESQDL